MRAGVPICADAQACAVVHAHAACTGFCIRIIAPSASGGACKCTLHCGRRVLSLLPRLSDISALPQPCFAGDQIEALQTVGSGSLCELVVGVLCLGGSHGWDQCNVLPLVQLGCRPCHWREGHCCPWPWARGCLACHARGRRQGCRALRRREQSQSLVVVLCVCACRRTLSTVDPF